MMFDILCYGGYVSRELILFLTAISASGSNDVVFTDFLYLKPCFSLVFLGLNEGAHKINSLLWLLFRMFLVATL